MECMDGPWTDCLLPWPRTVHSRNVRTCSLRTCELRDPTLGVHCCLWERMIKRFPNCCFASEGVQFVFSDCARAAESTVCSYVGMMRAGRRRLLEERSRPGVRVCDIITCKKARPNWLGPCGLDRIYITIGFDLVSDAGRRWSPLASESIIEARKCLNPLLWHLKDDDPLEEEDGEGWPPVYYCGYYGSRWCERHCHNDLSARRVTCVVCEVQCCVESCIPSPSRCCNFCKDFYSCDHGQCCVEARWARCDWSSPVHVLRHAGLGRPAGHADTPLDDQQAMLGLHQL